MRRLLGGAAFAALLAAGLPAAAQTDGGASPAAPPAASDQTAPVAPHKPAMSTSRHRSRSATVGKTAAKSKKRAAKHKTTARRRTSPADNMAEQLNKEELEKVRQNSGRMPASGSTMTPKTNGARTMPGNGTQFPDAGANPMPGTVTSGAAGHSKVQPQQ